MTTNMMTTRDFVTDHHIRATVEYAATNPNMGPSSDRMNNYKVTLRRGKCRMTVPFSTGIAWTREPDAADVLDCLASDAYGADQSFEDWCAEYGYEPDSRKIERMFKIIERQAKKLYNLLGGELYSQLLYQTKRL